MEKTILIIEDDDFLQGLEATKLKKVGYNVLTASNSVEAFDILNDNTKKIDLILLDLMLPNVSGFEILKKIKDTSNLKNIPVIIFSNLSDEKDIQETKKLGANDFMVKSNFTLDELVEKIKSLTEEDK